MDNETVPNGTKTGVHIGISDDYAQLHIGHFAEIWRPSVSSRDLHFYYGYEVTSCAEHGAPATCECEDREWCFEAVGSEESDYMILAASEISPKAMQGEAADMLLYGIGLWLTREFGVVPE